MASPLTPTLAEGSLLSLSPDPSLIHAEIIIKSGFVKFHPPALLRYTSVQTQFGFLPESPAYFQFHAKPSFLISSFCYIYD